ncbi:unnamed protein product [Bursaphelenchus okinawaensis]|uniref:Uncharacterized protein n=1 Tax=Bursaphelenchus okinawaensis TaxID=465554 RepID=A0A811L0N6_9BILA|nr:unnamed protein product [Bursaphelenchus okinawaensis]CAG9115356.1 unnamed protein product [Bursaphelenchus okinawaensis]
MLFATIAWQYPLVFVSYEALQYFQETNTLTYNWLTFIALFFNSVAFCICVTTVINMAVERVAACIFVKTYEQHTYCIVPILLMVNIVVALILIAEVSKPDPDDVYSGSVYKIPQSFNVDISLIAMIGWIVATFLGVIGGTVIYIISVKIDMSHKDRIGCTLQERYQLEANYFYTSVLLKTVKAYVIVAIFGGLTSSLILFNYYRDNVNSEELVLLCASHSVFADAYLCYFLSFLLFKYRPIQRRVKKDLKSLRKHLGYTKISDSKGRASAFVPKSTLEETKIHFDQLKTAWG